MDTDRAETEIGREFEAEDDDGEVETDSIQANQLDAFQERNYGVFTGFTTSVRGRPRVGDRAVVRRDRRSSRSRRTGKTTSTSTSTPQASSDADGILAFLDQSDEEIFDFFAAVPHKAEDLRDPEFFASRENTEADDSELVFKTSARLPAGRIAAQVRPRGLRPQPRLLLPRLRERGRRARGGRQRGCRCSTPRTSAPTAIVKWTKDFGTGATLELGARGEFTSLDIDVDGVRGAGRGRRRAGDDRHHIIDGNQIESTEDYVRVQPERAPALGRDRQRRRCA